MLLSKNVSTRQANGKSHGLLLSNHLFHIPYHSLSISSSNRADPYLHLWCFLELLRYCPEHQRNLWICFYWICYKWPMGTAVFLSWNVLHRSAVDLHLYFLHSISMCGQWEQWWRIKIGPWSSIYAEPLRKGFPLQIHTELALGELNIIRYRLNAFWNPHMWVCCLD